MQRIIVALFFLISSNLLFCEIVGVLPELLKPDMITVSGNRLYSIEGAKIYIYSLNDVKLIKRFGRVGEGPGEMAAGDIDSNELSVYSNNIVVRDGKKCLYFSMDGKYIKEKKMLWPPSGLLYLNSNFIGVKHLNDTMKNGRYDITLNIFDKDMKIIKELYRQNFLLQVDKKNNMIPDSINYCIYKDKIYVEKSLKGFMIEIYDFKGNSLYTIKKEIKKNKITKEYINKTIKRYKNDPIAKLLGVKKFEKKMYFPKYFPRIKNIMVNEDRIYVKTFKTKKDKEEYIIMELDGKIIKKVFLPETIKPKLVDLMKGNCGTFYFFKDNKFYYLKENENEKWELHVELF